MIFNIIEEVGSKSNRKRKILAFPGLPQAHGASFFARASPGNTHPQKRKKKKEKNRVFKQENQRKMGSELSFLLACLLSSGVGPICCLILLSRTLST